MSEWNTEEFDHTQDRLSDKGGIVKRDSRGTKNTTKRLEAQHGAEGARQQHSEGTSGAEGATALGRRGVHLDTAILTGKD